MQPMIMGNGSLRKDAPGCDHYGSGQISNMSKNVISSGGSSSQKTPHVYLNAS